MLKQDFTSRDAAVSALFRENPKLTNHQVAAKLGLTYQQTRESVKRQGIPRTNGRPRKEN